MNKLLPLATVVFFCLLPCGRGLAQNGGSNEGLGAFSGTWRGVCGDGNPFVILTLKSNGKDLGGDIAIANMNGDNGQCTAVIDPPSPDHAMKINAPRLEGKVLRFQGSPSARFEMALTGSDRAKLKFFGTPVEDKPWELTKSGQVR